MFWKKKKVKLMNEFGTIGEKKDYSKECTLNDTTDNHCLSCTNFIYPIGCKLNNIDYK